MWNDKNGVITHSCTHQTRTNRKMMIFWRQRKTKRTRATQPISMYGLNGDAFPIGLETRSLSMHTKSHIFFSSSLDWLAGCRYYCYCWCCWYFLYLLFLLLFLLLLSSVGMKMCPWYGYSRMNICIVFECVCVSDSVYSTQWEWVDGEWTGECVFFFGSYSTEKKRRKKQKAFVPHSIVISP